jgi:hypothetical protein
MGVREMHIVFWFGKRPLTRHRRRWQDNIKRGLKRRWDDMD